MNYSDTNPTNLRHPGIKDCSRLHTTHGAEWTTTAPIQSSLSTASWLWWWTLLSITVRSGDTNSKDVNGACDKRTHHATLADKNSLGDDKSTDCEHNPCGLKHERDKGPYKPPEHDERVSKQIHQREKRNGPRCTCIVQRKKRAHNTDEPLARICAATDITSTDLPFQNLYVVKYTMRTTEDTFVETLTHAQRLEQEQLHLRNSITNKQCAMRRAAH